MSIPNRPGSRAENLYGNMIGQETATPPENPQSRIEEYLDYIVNNGTKLEQEIKDEVDALKGIGRYLSLWDCTTGTPTTEPRKLPYKYKAGDYYIVSVVGATNYQPTGTQYEGIASTTVYSGDLAVNDFFIYDGSAWTLLSHSVVDTGMTNPMTTQGDIIYGGASGAPTRLAKGTAGQFLRMNAGGTAPEWQTVPDANGVGF